MIVPFLIPAMAMYLLRLLRRFFSGAKAGRAGPKAGLTTPWHARKPSWVRREILRMKASMPDAGCRTIEAIFNRRFAAVSGITVGKTYVARVLIADRRVARVRAAQAPESWPHNARWGLDLTSVLGADGRRYWILGIIEYRSCALLLLEVLIRKAATALARALSQAFERFGLPRTILTDNEGPFRSRLWKRLLRRAGVRHRRIRPYSPWQNGRIERFFGTLKSKLRPRGAQSRLGLQRDLDLFRYWYNRVRPHQALGVDGWRYTRRRLFLTPAEAWHWSAPQGLGTWFEGWGGLLRGYACRI